MGWRRAEIALRRVKSSRPNVVRTLAVFVVMILLLGRERASAWSTPLYSDAKVLQRAELIVVARLKPGSLARVQHRNSDGGRYEHHAVLQISQVIKGKWEKSELPIIIHYGLLPVPARYAKTLNDSSFLAPDQIPLYTSDETIRVFEDNPSEGFFRPSGDIRKDQIWCLRLHREAGVRDDSSVATTDSLGVGDPEDIQPLSKEQEFKR
jgi:hypothetical protein